MSLQALPRIYVPVLLGALLSAGVMHVTKKGKSPSEQLATWTDLIALAVLKGDAGAQGTPGQGVPAGGTTNQVLTKTGSADYAAEWRDAGGGDVLTALYVKRTNGVPAANGADARGHPPPF